VRERGTIVMLAGTYPAATNHVMITKPGVTVTADTGASVTIDGTVPLDLATRSDQGGLATFPYRQVWAEIGDGHDLLLLPAAVQSGALTPLARDRGWACVNPGAASYVAHGATSAGNPSGCPAGTTPRVITGLFPDQVWSAGRRLVQVGTRDRVAPGRFYVERTSATDRSTRLTTLVLHPTDAVSVRVGTPVGTTDPRGVASLLEAKAPGIRFHGLRVHGFSGPWWTYALHVYGGQQGFRVTDVEVTSPSGVAVKATGLPTPGGAGLLREVELRRLRISDAGWQGVVADYVTGLTIADSQFLRGNGDAERVEVAQVRVVKTHQASLTGSVIRDGVGNGVWFDQSCYEAHIVGNLIAGHSLSQLFYEFSHAGTIVGNVILGTPTDPALRLSGASATRLVNNTIVGGSEPIWIYTDNRAKLFRDAATGAVRSCADHPIRYGQADAAAAWRDCNITTVSDYDYARPGAFAPHGQANQTPGMNWRVSIRLMVNNVIGPSTGRNDCGLPVDPPVVWCIGGYTDFAGLVNEIPMNEILPADAVVDGNVYQGPGNLVSAWGGPNRPGAFVATSVGVLQAALGGSYYRMAAPERHARAGTGWTDAAGVPSAQLSAVHGGAAPLPDDARITRHLPAGARHYGAFLP
jgi:hypothetical protein